MKLKTILILLAFCITHIYAQSPMVRISIVGQVEEDTMVDFFWNSQSWKEYYSCGGRYYYAYRNFDDEDSAFEKNYKHLLNEKPSKKNFLQYFKLATIQWDKSLIDEAKRMFLNIETSKLTSYNTTYRHASDVGDGGNIYGYGSYTSNFKNEACRKLAEIYIETSKYDSALYYLKRADSMYEVHYSCGTGYHLDRGEMNGLYQYCYIHLKQYNYVIDKYFNEDYLDHEEALAIAFRYVYTKQQITDSLNSAIRSLKFVKDTVPREYYTYENYGKPDQKELHYKYYSGEATVMLFGKVIKLADPSLDKEKEMTKEDFVFRFRNSCFVRELLSTTED